MATNCYTPGVLSCEPGWSARVTTEGGRHTIADLTKFMKTGTFNRTLDGTSTADVLMTVETRAAQMCCEALADVGGGWGCMELELSRDAGICWAGPVTVTAWQYGALSLKAEDLTAWWRRRPIGDLNITADLATIFLAVHNLAMAEDPITGFTVAPTPTGVSANRVVVAKDDKFASDIIDELARTGIDYTAVGRDVLVGGGTIPAAPILNITDADWIGTGPTVEWAGDLYASRVIVHGGNSLRAVAQLAADKRPCGLVTRVFEEPTILDMTSLQAAANVRLAALSNPWRVTPSGNDRLKCGTAVDFAQLIPGARVRVVTNAACNPIQADFRLTGVAGDLNLNSVGVTLAPIGIGGFVAGQSDEGF